LSLNKKVGSLINKEIKNQKQIFTIDVEDYYHVVENNKGLIPVSAWDACDNLVEKNMMILLDTLEEHQSKATCFFLGYIAKRYPLLIKRTQERGHEIASHGMYHQLLHTMSQQKFIQDINYSKKLMEDLSGSEIIGYRAPCFSILEDTKTYYDELVKAGYRYDSSVFPATHDLATFIQIQSLGPYEVKTDFGSIMEIPISTVSLLKKRMCFFGGGYFRLFPYLLIDKMADKVIQENRPLILYLHPREIDPTHPRIKMSAKRYFKSYVNLKSVHSKLNQILFKHAFETIRYYMQNVLFKNA